MSLLTPPRGASRAGRAVVFLLAFATAPPANAETFLVDTLFDTPDASRGDGVCADSQDRCSLRAAIEESGELSGSDTVVVPEGTFTVGPLVWSGGGALVGSGPGRTRIVGDGSGRILSVRSSGLSLLSLRDVTLSGGRGRDRQHGGAIHVESDAIAIFTRVEVADSEARGDGGGVYCAGACALTEAHLHGNTAQPPSGSDAGFGGGLAVGVGGTATVVRSTLAGNSASAGGAIAAAGTVRVANSTLSGNQALEHSPGAARNGLGGGLLVGIAEAVTVELSNVTLAGNVAARNGGGAFLERGELRVRNSILAGNTRDPGGAADDCGRNLGNTVRSQGHNLFGVSRCGNLPVGGDHVGSEAQPVDAGLLPLSNNGGPTPTHAIVQSSLALDAGNASGCHDHAGALIGEDQRAVPRADGADTGPRCDIGAFELAFPRRVSDGGTADPRALLVLAVWGVLRRRFAWAKRAVPGSSLARPTRS